MSSPLPNTRTVNSTGCSISAAAQEQALQSNDIITWNGRVCCLNIGSQAPETISSPYLQDCSLVETVTVCDTTAGPLNVFLPNLTPSSNGFLKTFVNVGGSSNVNLTGASIAPTTLLPGQALTYMWCRGGWGLYTFSGSGAPAAMLGPYTILWYEIEPSEPALWALPSNSEYDPAQGPPWPSVSYAFILPRAATLTGVYLKGDAAQIGSINSVGGISPPSSVPVVRSSAVASSGTAQPTSQAVVLASVLAGSSVYVAVESLEDVSSVTDSAGNVYELATSASFINLIIGWWYTDNVSAATPLTITVNASSSSYLVVEAVEITGANPNGSLDRTGGGSPDFNSDTVTPSAGNDLGLLKVADYDDSGVYSATGGSTLIQSNPGDGGITQPVAAGILSQMLGASAIPVTISANFSGPTQTLGQYGGLAVAVMGIPTPLPVNLDLWLNGAPAGTLLTIPPGQSTFDIRATPNIPVPENALVQYVVDLTDWAVGDIGNFLLSVSYQ